MLFYYLKTMHNIHLETFAQITGIGSASGLFLSNNLLYVIGDNSSYLYEYNISTKNLNKIQLFSRGQSVPSENIPKALKPDFEVLCQHENVLYILGSGSTAKRNLMVQYDLVNKKITQTDLTDVYNKLRSASSINHENFNIEGAIFTGSEWLLFNRGNGESATNGIFKIAGSSLAKAEKTSFIRILLPNINHIASSFTDAVLHKNKIYFISTAEDTSSTYNDGEILGSFLGCLDLDTLKLNFIHKISNSQKFEGITVLKEYENKIEFLLCEDRDTEELNTTIYKCTLNS